MKIFAASALALLLSAAVGNAAAGPRDHGNGYGEGQYHSYTHGRDRDVAPLIVGALIGYGISASEHQNDYGQNGAYGYAGYYRNQGYYGNQGYSGSQSYSYAEQRYADPYRVRFVHRAPVYYGNSGYYRNDEHDYRDTHQRDRGYRADDRGFWDEGRREPHYGGE